MQNVTVITADYVFERNNLLITPCTMKPPQIQVTNYPDYPVPTISLLIHCDAESLETFRRDVFSYTGIYPNCIGETKELLMRTFFDKFQVLNINIIFNDWN